MRQPLSHPILSGQNPEFLRLLEALPAGAYTCNSEGLITYFNASAVQIWGCSPLLNDPVDRFCGSLRLFAPDGSPLSPDQCRMARAPNSSESFCGEEIIIEREDGSRLNVLAHANPLFDNSGRMNGTLNILVDITNQKQGDEAQLLLASIVESSEDAIISKDLNGRIRSWNAGAQQMFGYSSEEAIGQPIELIVPEDRREEERQIRDRLRSGERGSHFETVRIARGGRTVEISLSYSPIRNLQGKVIGASYIGRDITRYKQADAALLKLNAQLRDADRHKDEFLATLAHELRNPLAPISNSLHILRLCENLGPSLERIRDIMEQQVSHMVRLVDDLLDVSRISCGKIKLRKEQVELAGIVANAIETSRTQIDAAGHQLVTSLPSTPLILEADSVRLAQVIGNLLTNAAKYTEPGGQIRLTVRPEGNEAVVSVRDTGVGIPAEMLDQVFDMFTQVERNLNRSQGGLGIGLTLARSLVALHGGSIEAHNNETGGGSEFLIRLPLLVSPAQPAHSASTPPRSFRSLPTFRILVVDDTRAAAFVLGQLLEMLGNEVQTVHDGNSALEILQSTRPDLVFSDIAMPVMDGYELATRIRQVPEFRDLVLVALTGYGQDEDRRRVREAGFDHHLVKPVSLDHLQELLTSLASVDRTSGTTPTVRRG